MDAMEGNGSMRRCRERTLRQRRVEVWVLETFGEGSMSVEGRILRFVEEAIELAQACGMDPARIAQLTEYVYARPVGDIEQEMGGVGTCLLALAQAVGVDADTAEVRELSRAMRMPLDEIRTRHQAKVEAGITHRRPAGSETASDG